MNGRALTTWAVSLCALAGTAMGQVQAKDSVFAPDELAGRRPDATVENGVRRVFETRLVPASAARLNEIAAAGKKAEVDPRTGQLVQRTFRDYLPADWRAGAAEGGFPTDSYGNPIVNEVPGLPAWAQRDVDALRGQIAHWRDALNDQSSRGLDTRETEGILGNFVGQAIARWVPFADIIPLEALNKGTAAAVIGQLHFIENTRFSRQSLWNFRYEPSVYPAGVAEFLAAHGASLADVLRIEEMPQGVSTPSGCYNMTTQAVGITFIAGYTTIWQQTGDDDAQADVPIGFPFVVYGCDTGMPNGSVRVSTNGYISFFQLGGGALDGTDFSNDDITNTLDPDGFAAPFWDDFWLAPAQGNTDRIAYVVEGAAPNRVFTVESFSLSHLGGTNTDFHFFQVKLYEGSQAVEFDYGTGGNWQPDTGTSGTQGMEDLGGDDGDCGPNCSGTNVTPTDNYRFTPVAPFNNACANARDVNSGTYAGTLWGASNDGTATCGASGANADAWYHFFSVPGTVTVSACGTHDAYGVDMGMDTVLSILDGCGGAQLACNDDNTGQCGASDSGIHRDSYISMATAGGDRWIRVSKFGTGDQASGPFTLNVSLPAPGNDNCASATNVGEGTFNFTTWGATNDGTATCGFSGTTPDVWFRYTPTQTGVATIGTCGSGYDTVLSLRATCGGAEIQCNDDACGLQSRLTQNVTAGQPVLVRLSGFSGSFGTGVLTISVASGACSAAPAGAVAEPEACGGDVNGGCNMPTPGYTNMALNSSVRGTAWADAGTRDTDWYHVNLTAGQTITVCANAEFDYVTYVINDDCANIQILATGGSTACTQSSLDYPVPASGTYVLFMGTSAFDGTPCSGGDAGNRYWMSVRTNGTCPPVGGNCPWSGIGCVADFNGSGGTPDDADIAAFFNAWNSGNECADANQSGGTPDDADVSFFFARWNAGGC